MFGDFNGKFFSSILLDATIDTCMSPFSDFLFQVVGVLELTLNILFLDHSNLIKDLNMFLDFKWQYSFEGGTLSQNLFLLVLI